MLFFQSKRMQIVTIDSPTAIWHHQDVRSLFGDIVQLKLNGYENGFSNANSKVLPFDASDFYGIHQAICLREGEQLVPVLVFKSVPFDYCQEYNHSLPIQQMISKIDDNRYSCSLDDYLAAVERRGERVSYNCALTVDPSLHDPELKYEVFKVFVALAQYHMDGNNLQHYIMTATTKFKTEKLFKKIGFQRLSFQGEDLPPVSIPSLANEAVSFFICDGNFTVWARKIMKEYRFLWENRIVYSEEALGNKEHKKAA